MAQENNRIKKCSKCGKERDQKMEPGFQTFESENRIFTKDEKHFCFDCLASEYSVDCHYCHKRINSKEELAYWSGGVLSINGDYDY